MKFILSVLLAMLGIFTQAQSQCNFTISGTLVDKQGGELLEFANIYIIETKSGAISDDFGRFSITGLCPGTYTLKIEHIGCHTLIKKIQITNIDITLKIEMDHSAHDLGEVEVAAHKNEKSVGRTSETMEGISLKKSRGENLGNTLARLNGINVIQTGATIAKPVIHGMHSNRVLILNNGIRQEGQQWGAEHAPEIDPFIAKKITVIKGANTIKYGADAIAGVILVEPGELPDSSGIAGELDLSGASNGRLGASSALIEGNLKEARNLKFRLQGTVRRSGNMNTPDYYLENTGLSENNFSLALAKQFGNLESEVYYSQFNTKIGIYTGSHLGNTSDLIELFSNPAKPAGTSFSYSVGRPFQELSHELFKTRLKLNFHNLNSLSLVYSRQFNQRFEYDRHPPKNDSLAALNRPEFRYFITTHILDLEYQLHHHNHFEGSTGISALYQENTYNGRLFIPNFRNQGIGAYWVERYHKNELQLEIGARLDHRFLQVYKAENGTVVSPEFTYTKPSLSLAANYQLLPKLSVSVFSGTAWRPPAVNELFSNGLHHGSATIEIGNSKLKTESNWNNSISANYRSSRINAEISLYHNLLNGFINLVPSGVTSLTIRGAFPTYVYIQQNAVFKGIDLSARLAIDPHLNATLQYNMVRANERKTGNYLSQIPADRLRIGLERKLGKKENLSLAVTGMYVARQTRYANQQVISQEDGKQITITDFAPPPADYFLVEAELTAELKLGKQPLLVSLSGNNLLNRRYRNYLNRFRYFADETGRNIQLRVSLPFTIKKK